jgi:hypothetical protein
MDIVPMTPYTTVKLLSNVPLDNSYKDTLDFFANVSEQYNYFNGKSTYSFNNLTPVKMQNTIRIPKNADQLYNCNYVMFQNANFNNKWFYAFISDIEYVSTNMSNVKFELDVWQTWRFDITLKPSFVEREHSSSDTVGINLVNESIDLGQYREEVAETTTFFDSYSAVIATAYNPDGKSGGYIGGLFTGLNYVSGLVDNSEEVQALIDYLDVTVQANKQDAITSIFLMPTHFFTTSDTPVMTRFDATKQVSALGSYTPKNKKLLTYPYNFLYVYTTDGNSAIYRYEYFLNPSSCGFNVECAMSCNPEIVLEPIGYNNQQFNVDESLTMTGFPQCAYSIDSFKAWLAQNSSGTALLGLSSAIGLGAGITSGNPVAIGGGLVGMSSLVNSVVMASAKPPQARGTQGNSTFTGTREKNFYFVNKHVSEEYAKIIDDYFSMYGYATNRVKVPNINGRPSWNYVKTQNCKIVGNVPFNDIVKIRKMFDNGITFWHGDYVGDYTRNNQV